MLIRVEIEDCEDSWVDRDNTIDSEAGCGGLDVRLGTVYLHFQSEKQAVELARMILRRMGELREE